MKIKAHAKLNFYLEILGRRDDGFHNLTSIMQQILLHDVLVFNHSDQDQWLYRNRPMPPYNLVARALTLLREHVDVPPVKLELRKQIPIGAGLGGGSSDAAATLVGLDRFFSLGLAMETLRQLAATLGSDVPFFIDTPAALVEGTGTKITPLPPLDIPHILLARPRGKISTVAAYNELTPADYRLAGEAEDFTALWNRGILGTCFNHLEAPVFRLDPKIEHLKQVMLSTEPIQCLMTGSGNVVFAIYSSKDDLYQARKIIAPAAAWVRASATLKGIE
ncbi:MAG TPA: 4-(cytidine 5'-diphospho)-2-C-methyl-D-erythritol kinase [Tissierellia bacterium]|nr:4-(cytidine 5'-diphospho)-2-C-methyl-D-erythritol kinase [Tissierellia bacterium]